MKINAKEGNHVRSGHREKEINPWQQALRGLCFLFVFPSGHGG